MRHKTVVHVSAGDWTISSDEHYFVIRSSIDRGSRKKVGSVTLLRSAPGRNWEIMWESTELINKVVASVVTIKYLTAALLFINGHLIVPSNIVRISVNRAPRLACILFQYIALSYVASHACAMLG